MNKFTNIEQIYELLGKNTVLIPLRKGTKKASVKTWKDLTLEKTLETQFQDKLRRATNVGVVQGTRSNNICSIDLDEDELAEEFLCHNPSLESTLITKGARGVNIWFEALGDCPRLTTLKPSGTGEVRGEGAYTLIKGIHTSGIEYSIINENKPVSIEFEKIKLPPYGVKNSPQYFTNSKTKSVTKTIPISYDYITSESFPIQDKVQALLEVNKRYEAWSKDAPPQITKKYETYILREDEMDFNIRNHELIRQTTLLYKRVGLEMTKILMLAFYEINQPFFSACIHDHMKEFSAHLMALEKDFRSTLTKSELIDYDRIGSLHQDAYRICRDLASFDDCEFPPPLFHLSYNELGSRINVHPQIAQRIMKDMKSIRCVSLEKKGLVYSRGKPKRASVWKWLHSLNLLEKVA